MQKQMKENFSRIISGGQTGVDRAALDAALGIRPARPEVGAQEAGGPKTGRSIRDIPFRRPISSSYPVRTEKNVLEADGTLILTRGKAQGRYGPDPKIGSL